MRDYIALLRMLRKLRESVLGFAGLKHLAFDKEMAEAAEYDAQQADYLPRLVNDLRNRMVAGDDTACILGNILRQGLLNEDELLSISKTGSRCKLLMDQIMDRCTDQGLFSPLVSSGINLGYSHTWLIGYLASRPDLQEQAFQAIREIYDGQVPDPEEFDRVDFVRALHTVSFLRTIPHRLVIILVTLTDSTCHGITGRVANIHPGPHWLPKADVLCYELFEPRDPERHGMLLSPSIQHKHCPAD